MKPLTEFQSKLFAALKARPFEFISTHSLAANVFPERWARRSGKGALIGHIDRALSDIPNVHRSPQRAQHEPARFTFIPKRK